MRARSPPRRRRATWSTARAAATRSSASTARRPVARGVAAGRRGLGANPPGRLRTHDGALAFDGELATLDGAYASYYAAVADSIERGVPFPVTPAEAVDVMTVIELAHASHEQGRRLPF